MTRAVTVSTLIVILLSINATVVAQPAVIAKEIYDQALEKAQAAQTYPFREIIKTGPYTYHDSLGDEGVEVRSRTTVLEHYRSDRIRITVEVETEKGKTVARHLQVGSQCFSQAGASWKRSQSCGDGDSFTIGMRPDKEEFYMEDEILDGKKIKIYRYFRTNSVTGREGSSFAVDNRGRLVRLEQSGKITVYEYGAKISPVVAPRLTRARR